MIKNFILFEKLNQGEPKVGHYVICEDINDDLFPDLENYLSANIGIIKTIMGKITFLVEYKNSSLSFFTNDLRPFLREEIKYWSKDKEDLLPFLDAKKFGL